MNRKLALPVALVFVAWSAMDFVIHGLLLKGAYASTPALWRPLAEMKQGLLSATTLLTALAFVWLYARFVEPKGVARGLWFGLLYGFSIGVGMGYGSYAVMPIPYSMALTWFLGTVAEGTVAGLIAGAVVRRQQP